MSNPGIVTAIWQIRYRFQWDAMTREGRDGVFSRDVLLKLYQKRLAWRLELVEHSAFFAARVVSLFLGKLSVMWCVWSPCPSNQKQSLLVIHLTCQALKFHWCNTFTGQDLYGCMAGPLVLWVKPQVIHEWLWWWRGVGPKKRRNLPTFYPTITISLSCTCPNTNFDDGYLLILSNIFGRWERRKWQKTCAYNCFSCLFLCPLFDLKWALDEVTTSYTLKSILQSKLKLEDESLSYFEFKLKGLPLSLQQSISWARSNLSTR